jgi:hypothetical protein
VQQTENSMVYLWPILRFGDGMPRLVLDELLLM